MDVIVQSIAAVLAFVFGIVGNIFAHDICVSVDSVCTKIIKAAAARLASFDQDATEQEWLSDLHDHQTVFEKYRHAIGCYFAAPKMRRYALANFSAHTLGLVWRLRSQDIMEARWHSTAEAIEAGYPVKSVKLGSWTDIDNLPAKDKEFLVDVTRQLQAEHDQWLYDDAFRERRGEAKWREQEIKRLVASGYTRQQAWAEIIALKKRTPE